MPSQAFEVRLSHNENCCESGATVACICAADETYGQLGEAVAAILKPAGARHVTLAGRPKDLTAGLAKAGVDSFIFAGADRLALLRTLHAALGLAGPAADGVALGEPPAQIRDG